MSLKKLLNFDQDVKITTTQWFGESNNYILILCKTEQNKTDKLMQAGQSCLGKWFVQLNIHFPKSFLLGIKIFTDHDNVVKLS